MGCFDTVHAFCLNCGTEHEIQSKTGPCAQKHYHQDSVPADVAEDVNGESWICPECGSRCWLSCPHMPRVRMTAYLKNNEIDEREWD